jgi:hypothetical protein
MTLLLAAGTLGTLTGTATAAPPEGRGATTDWYATTLMGAGGPLTVDATVRQTKDGPVTSDVTVFLDGLRCSPTEPLDATLVPLESATLSGAVDLTCVSEGPGQGLTTTSGTLAVDLTWTGTGDTTRIPLTGNLDHCVGRFLERDATLAGSVTVSIAGSDEQVLTAGDSGDTALRWQHVACPPPKG